MLSVRADRKLRWLFAVTAAIRGAVKAVVPGQKHAKEKDLLKTCAHGVFEFIMLQCSPKAETCCSRSTDAAMQDIADDSMLYAGARCRVLSRLTVTRPFDCCSLCGAAGDVGAPPVPSDDPIKLMNDPKKMVHVKAAMFHKVN
jgi:hypothetical protein